MNQEGVCFSHEEDISGKLGEFPDIHSYDHIITMWSGGKDSLAQTLFLLELGVDKEKIEMWHHLVDGREGSSLMDWPVTEDYCQQVADHLGIIHRYSWKQGGFEREMNRYNDPTSTIHFETPLGLQSAGGRGPNGTRRRFPQVSADLSVRWCSAYLKIDVASAALRNDERFRNKRVLVVTGERAEESAARAKYKSFEPHKADLRGGKKFTRHIDQWRPVLHWNEEEVWNIIKKYQINPHPAYRIGFGRTSCMSCIFGSSNQWATIKTYAPEHFNRIAEYEEQFGSTIQRKRTVRELAEEGTPYCADPALISMAMSPFYTDQVFVEDWSFPAGAFGESAGPT